jgi:hypothetical protein
MCVCADQMVALTERVGAGVYYNPSVHALDQARHPILVCMQEGCNMEVMM